MKRIVLAMVLSLFAVSGAMAQDMSCEAKAVGKDGKPLVGAAKAASIKKCKTDACNAKAVGKDGKPLAGAAKASSVKKCLAG